MNREFYYNIKTKSNRFMDFQKMKESGLTTDYVDEEPIHYDNPKLKNFVPKKTSMLTTLCDNEGSCIRY